MNKADTQLLLDLNACASARAWCASYPSLDAAWVACTHRPDWMFWLLGALRVPREQLVLAACACARLSLPHVPAGEMRPLRAIETAEAWVRGEATIAQVRAAAYAADATAYAAAAYAADAAAYAAADAAARAADARMQVKAQCCDLIRVQFPVVPRAQKAVA